MASSKIRCTASCLLPLLLLGLSASNAAARPWFGGFGGGSFNPGNTNTLTTGSFAGASNTAAGMTGQQPGMLANSAAGTGTMAAAGTTAGFGRRLISFTALLSGANQVPTPVQSAATATFSLTIDTVNQVGFYTLTIRNVAQFTMAHIHQGNAATNGAPIVLLLPNMAAPGAMPTPGVVTTLPMAPPTNINFGIYHGVITPASLITLDPATPAPTWAQFVALLQTGNAYANIHTTAFPAGEIRGQYMPDAL